MAQAARRRSTGVSTLLMPASVTPRRMNGATVAGKSIPCARPHAATMPSYFVEAHTLTSVCEPTVSTAAAHRSVCSGLPGCESEARSMTSRAPSSRR